MPRTSPTSSRPQLCAWRGAPVCVGREGAGMDDRETIRQRLVDAVAEAAYARTLAGPIAAVKEDVEALAVEAASLRIRLETLWDGDILELTRAHDRLLDDLF